MNTIVLSQHFEDWLFKLRDLKGKALILDRLQRAKFGAFGRVKNIGGGLWEMKLDFGPGYRLYYARKGQTVYVILIGDDKSTQQNDIEEARYIMERYNEK